MDTLTPLERSAQMRRVKSSDTKPERELRRIVWGLGYHYRKNRRDVTGNPDIAFVGRKRAIFLHGCFWHRHDCASGRRLPKSRLDFWKTKFERNVLRDEAVAIGLRQVGWRALVVWECELCDRSGVAQRIRKFLDA
ncbi:very short patch repair endonuclease [Methylocapsa sp. S129]|uniref:very short patch repair endonuclease n=1 Tax=Methylocapsa sp. S129 TaxID=1641869 RepID=UPI00131AAAA5|nr:very short patch repair endonuclease [Methylocapsa sp. S129]